MWLGLPPRELRKARERAINIPFVTKTVGGPSGTVEEKQKLLFAFWVGNIVNNAGENPKEGMSKSPSPSQTPS